MTKAPYRPEIDAAAKLHSLDADLVAAVVEQESNGWASAFRYEPDFWAKYLAKNPAWKNRNPREVSASYGLLQTMYPVAVEHDFMGQPWELFNPVTSLEYGCRVLSKLMAWAEANKTKALGAYNAGKGGWDGTWGRKYSKEVLTRYERIKREKP